MPSASSPEIEPFIVADVHAWRAWLDAHEQDQDGVWLVLAKKGTTSPTSLTYAQALDEALCSGWIDGQKRSFDTATFLQRFTPRRKRSMWSARNVEHIARLEAEGRMRERGRTEVVAAKGDGRWDRAYAGGASVQVPDDLTEALTAAPGAADAFAQLSATARYSVLHPIISAVKDETRTRRITKAVAQLTADTELTN